MCDYRDHGSSLFLLKYASNLWFCLSLPIDFPYERRNNCSAKKNATCNMKKKRVWPFNKKKMPGLSDDTIIYDAVCYGAKVYFVSMIVVL